MALLMVGSMAGMATVLVMLPIFCTAHFILSNSPMTCCRLVCWAAVQATACTATRLRPRLGAEWFRKALQGVILGDWPDRG